MKYGGTGWKYGELPGESDARDQYGMMWREIREIQNRKSDPLEPMTIEDWERACRELIDEVFTLRRELGVLRGHKLWCTHHHMKDTSE